MNERYECNMGAVTQGEQERLKTSRAAIVGCGGLGAYIAEFLARLGVGHLTLVDGDVFAVSNLNRQLYSLEENLGKNKALEAKKRLLQIRSDLSVTALDTFLNDENAEELLKGHDVILDALDNVNMRLLLEKTANTLNLPLIHGAVEDCYAQVSTVFPGDFLLSMLYSANRELEKSRSFEKAPSVLSFTPAFCASIQASEAVKVLLNKENVLRKKLLTADIKNCSFNIIDL
jgi:molybdopterin/thiamine biosynthesis adenylyltransferase